MASDWRMPQRWSTSRYWRQATGRSWKGIGSTGKVSAPGGSIIAAIIATWAKILPRAELPRTIMVIVIGAVAGVAVDFFIRLLFVSPKQIHDEMRQQISRYESFYLLSALWGVEGGWKNVTDTARKHVSPDGNSFEMTCSIDLLGDPRRDLPKVLIVQYWYGGDILSKSFEENEVARLPLRDQRDNIA